MKRRLHWQNGSFRGFWSWFIRHGTWNPSRRTAAGLARRSTGTKSVASCSAASWTLPFSTSTCRPRSGDWRPADGETAADLARLKASFPTPRDAVAYIMDTFPIVRRRDEAKFGEYRTKRVILDIYDAMQQAITTGEPYHTRLDPLPADPRVAHEAQVLST